MLCTSESVAKYKPIIGLLTSSIRSVTSSMKLEKMDGFRSLRQINGYSAVGI